MGLIDQARRHGSTAVSLADSKKKTGLLNRIHESSDFDVLVSGFSRLREETGAEKAILLMPTEDDVLVPVLCESIDLTTCRRFVPLQSDFLKIMPEDRQYAFIDEALQKFHPYFSSRERESLDRILVFPRFIRNSRCYLVVIESRLSINRARLDDDCIHLRFGEFAAAMGDKSAVLSALAVSKPLNRRREVDLARIESAIADGKRASLITLSFKKLFNDPLKLETDDRLMSVYHAIIHRISRQCGDNNIVRVNPGLDARLVVFTSSPADSELYIRQMMKPMERLFGTFRISRIETEFRDSVADKGMILEFMAGGD